MKKIIEYKIEYGSEANDLSYTISRMIENGWQPFGSPYYMENRGVHCQAMVVYEGDDEKDC